MTANSAFNMIPGAADPHMTNFADLLAAGQEHRESCDVDPRVLVRITLEKAGDLGQVGLPSLNLPFMRQFRDKSNPIFAGSLANRNPVHRAGCQINSYTNPTGSESAGLQSDAGRSVAKRQSYM